MTATRATNGTTMCGSNMSPLEQQQQQQDVSDPVTNSNTTRTIDAYPTANGTPIRYQCCKIYLNKLDWIEPLYIFYKWMLFYSFKTLKIELL